MGGMRTVFFVVSGVAVLLLAVADAFAAKESVPVAVDRRIRSIVYAPNEVFHFVGHYGYQSTIEFEVGEEIQTISMGDSVAWQITPTDNRIFLKPVAQSADTNMTVITNKRFYLFELIGREAEGLRDKDMIFVMKFVYPNSGGGTATYQRELPIPDLDRDRSKLNFSYTISGDERFQPIRIFDDGKFTYFQFPKNIPDLPAFFMVDEENNESIVNYRIREDYVVVERIAERFTLRNGKNITCVYNERIYRGQKKDEQSSGGQSQAQPTVKF